MSKNVILLGGSNSVMVNGLQKGLKEGIEELNIIGNRMKFCNLALGATSIQNLYEIKRKRNKNILEHAELIITESNINEISANDGGFPLDIICRNLSWFYQELYFLNKRVLVLLLPLQKGNYKIINNLHKKLCIKFGFNLINLQNYYEIKSLNEFGNRIDIYHQQGRIMQELGKIVIKNINKYNFPKRYNFNNDNPCFVICTPRDMELISGKLNEKCMKNSAFNEITYEINENTTLQFPNLYKNYKIIALHSWNHYENIELDWTNSILNYSNLTIINKETSLNKEMCFYNYVLEFCYPIALDDRTIVSCNQNNNAIIKEYYHAAFSQSPGSIKAKHFNLISFFLASPEGNYHTEEIDFEALANENIEIPEEYNFNHLIPSIELYKEIIDEYCSTMDPRKLAPLQNQIKEKDNIIFTLNQEKTTLQNELNSLPIQKQNLEIKNLEQDLIIKKLESKKLAKSLGIKMSIINPKITFIQANSAKSRIQNHLSYKLGQALIENSKSILGYIRMPYVLSYIKDKHKLEQKAYEEKIKENPNLALPPLETYPDYNEALKEKECFTYKLGEEFIKASRNWYGGGYIKFILRDVPRLKREFVKKG